MCNVFLILLKMDCYRFFYKSWKKIAHWFCVLEVEEPVISEGQKGM